MKKKKQVIKLFLPILQNKNIKIVCQISEETNFFFQEPDLLLTFGTKISYMQVSFWYEELVFGSISFSFSLKESLT